MIVKELIQNDCSKKNLIKELSIILQKEEREKKKKLEEEKMINKKFIKKSIQGTFLDSNKSNNHILPSFTKKLFWKII